MSFNKVRMLLSLVIRLCYKSI